MRVRMSVSQAAAVNFFCIDPENCGDMTSTPFTYFKTSSLVKKMHIKFLDSETMPWFKKKKVVLGGGGMFFFNRILTPLVEAKPKVLIGWGIGVNHHFNGVGGGLVGTNQFDLLGLRDWGLGQEWVPCASCLSPFFDEYRNAPIKESVVVYDHAIFPVPVQSFKRMSNQVSMRQAIEHISSAEVVLTSSYHGVYWATLLGKKVVMFPFSTKFDHLRYPVYKGSRQDWHEKIRIAKTYPEALAECREKNMSFARRVSERIGIEMLPNQSAPTLSF